MNFIKFYRAWKEEQKVTVECRECGKDFNVTKQAAICPHIPIQEFIYGKNEVDRLIAGLRKGWIDPDDARIKRLSEAIEQARVIKVRMAIERLPDFKKE